MYGLNSFSDREGFKPIDTTRYSAIHAEAPSSRVSSKYLFIPTTQALSVLADHGWVPCKVKQANTRIEENQGFQKHVIRLVNEKYNTELMVNDTVPQLMLTNSHSGTSAFELSVALYRKVCANGLCVSDSTLDSIKIRHVGYQDQSMSDACLRLASGLPEVLESVENFKKIKLEREEMRIMAQTAIEMRFDGEKYTVEPEEVLRTRRYADRENTSLWNTYNVIQENVIKGGVRQRRSDGSRIRSKEVKSIDEDTKLNRMLWSMTAKMAELKA